MPHTFSNYGNDKFKARLSGYAGCSWPFYFMHILTSGEPDIFQLTYFDQEQQPHISLSKSTYTNVHKLKHLGE